MFIYSQLLYNKRGVCIGVLSFNVHLHRYEEKYYWYIDNYHAANLYRFGGFAGSLY